MLNGNNQAHGLARDVLPIIRMLQYLGTFLHGFDDGSTSVGGLIWNLYGIVNMILLYLHWTLLVIFTATNAGIVSELASNTVTVLFFTHSIVKNTYLLMLRGTFTRVLNIWNNPNSHPVFMESNNRYRAIALSGIKKVTTVVVTMTLLSYAAWLVHTFVGDSTRNVKDPDNDNETIKIPAPRLMVRSYYPFDAMTGMGYYMALGFQMYIILVAMGITNLFDTMLCCWLHFACEQICHLKDCLEPLMEVASAGRVQKSSADLFKADSEKKKIMDAEYISTFEGTDFTGVYTTHQEMGGGFNYRQSTLQTFGENEKNELNSENIMDRKQEVYVRSAIKYWVERHKHVTRLVDEIEETYGISLLMHMLTSTIALTILSYQATNITAPDKFAFATIGYLVYGLSQIFLFSFYGNRLIEESSSVMEAAYSCKWYEGNEDSKTFVQIICQQCQKSMSISGAKFFTVSLDLFASVLGAVVTYFMVLIQLK